MILLESGNRILGETIAAQFKAPENIQGDDGSETKGVRIPIDIRLCDFDDALYHVANDHEQANLLRVSMSLPCWSQIRSVGGEETLNRVYGSMVQSPPEAGFDVTLLLDLDNIPAGETAQTLTDKIGKLKSTLVGSAFDFHFQSLLDGKTSNSSPSTQFALRPDTSVYFFPRADRVTVVFGVQFQDRVDSAIAKVFMQEFVDARRKLGSAPPCTFGVNPPLEMKEVGVTEPTGNLGFISFAVMKSHLESGRKARVVDVLAAFRSYIQYHLKCSKSHFHSRMRARVVSLLKLLNRAKVDNADDKKEKKTISGKTFIRQS